MRPRVSAPALSLALALAATLASAAPAAAALRTGCDSSRPALTYRVGAGQVDDPATRAPVPCLQLVSGRAGESANVAVLPSGRILYGPIVANDYPAPLDDRGPALVAASDDGGHAWRTLTPGSPDHALEVPPWMDADPQTHRIWFASALPTLCGGEISWSDDGGSDWSTNPLVGCPAMGSERVLEGPAPAGGAQPAGYPHVVYYCANLNDLSQSQLYCYRSLDGGTSFASTGGLPDPPSQSGCSTQHPARPGAVGPDGVLYFPVLQCGQLSVAVSRDEGSSWQLLTVATSDVQDLYTTSLAIDSAGNLYLAWIAKPGAGVSNPDGIMASGEPTLAVSRDHGRTWSSPEPIGPPGVKDAQLIAITAAATPGKIAVSYLANQNGSTLLEGWLSESTDALVPHARWWAAALDAPAQPLINSSDSTTFGDRLFVNTDTFAPNGLPWVAFHCAKTSPCPGERVGVVGELAPPPPIPPLSRLVSLPSTRRCLAHDTLRIRVHPFAGVSVSATRLRIGRRWARAFTRASIVVRPTPRGRFRLRLGLELLGGGDVGLTRTYRGC